MSLFFTDFEIFCCTIFPSRTPFYIYDSWIKLIYSHHFCSRVGFYFKWNSHGSFASPCNLVFIHIEGASYLILFTWKETLELNNLSAFLLNTWAIYFKWVIMIFISFDLAILNDVIMKISGIFECYSICQIIEYQTELWVQ